MTPHFTLNELSCRCGCVMPEEVLRRLRALANALEVIRAAVGKPVQVISGYRCAAHNRKVGGAVNSRHTWGDAVDIQVQGMSGAELRDLVEQLIARKQLPDGGVGTYSKKVLTLHYDLRGIRARWHH